MSESPNLPEPEVIPMTADEVPRKRNFLRDLFLVCSLIVLGLLAAKRYHAGPPVEAPDVLQAQAERIPIPVVETTEKELRALSGTWSVAGIAALGSEVDLGRATEGTREWARYETSHGDAIAINNRERDRKIVFLQGTTLLNDDKVVLSAGAKAPDWSPPGIEMQVKDGKVYGFTIGSFSEALAAFPSYDDGPAIIWAPHSSMPKGYLKLLNIFRHGEDSGILSNFDKVKVKSKDLVLVDGQPVLNALAQSSKKESLVRYLVKNGADVSQKDLSGRTAWDVGATENIRALVTE